MSYRYETPSRSGQQLPSAPSIMLGMLIVFVIVSLAVLLAGRVPFVPSITPLDGPTYREYVVPDRELLSSYGRTTEGAVHIPIDLAMDLVVERGLPTRNNPSPTP